MPAPPCGGVETEEPPCPQAASIPAARASATIHAKVFFIFISSFYCYAARVQRKRLLRDIYSKYFILMKFYSTIKV